MSVPAEVKEEFSADLDAYAADYEGSLRSHIQTVDAGQSATESLAEKADASLHTRAVDTIFGDGGLEA